MKKILKYAIFVAVLALAACSKDSDIVPGQEMIVMKGVDKNPLVNFAIEETVPVSYPISVLSTGKVDEDIKADIAIDNSLVDVYNAEHKTSFYALPESDLKLDSAYVNIYKGKAASAVNHLTLTSLAHIEDGKTYMIPVTIKDVSGSRQVLEAERTIYVKLARTIIHSSLDINNPSFYSNFIFSDDKAVQLDQYTFEIKFYAYGWSGMTPTLSRLCAFLTKGEENQLLYRFGEVSAEDVLQVMTPGATLVSNTHYQLNKWNMLSVVYDGASVSLLNDGVVDVSAATGSGSINFQRLELGMSYQGYNTSQRFNGRVAEIRIWNRPLSSSEIKGNLCGAAADSEGLVAYWKFDEASGSIFKDVTGHGYDMDWSKTYRAVSGDELTLQDKSAYIERVKDEKNKCAN